jgi:hypothetical protein
MPSILFRDFKIIMNTVRLSSKKEVNVFGRSDSGLLMVDDHIKKLN